MIEKLKFLNITGPKDDIDRVVETYLSKHEIHLESVLSELKTAENITPFTGVNPYRTLLNSAQEYIRISQFKDTEVPEDQDWEPKEAMAFVDRLGSNITKLLNEKKKLEEIHDQYTNSLQVIAPFRTLLIDIPTVLHYEFIKFRFGKIALESYKKFSNYVYENLDAIFLEGERDENYVWGVYFSTRAQINKVDLTLTSLHFERIYMPDEYTSTPAAACEELDGKLQEIKDRISQVDEKIQTLLNDNQQELLLAHKVLHKQSNNYDIRKLAGCIEKKNGQFYILCGWMTEKDTAAFIKEISNDDKVYVIKEDDPEGIFSAPPTKLKNLRIFKPFELFIRMYGLPAYTEWDPTGFVAITYAFIFGIMFGDVGQGLCLVVGGFLLYKWKKLPLAAIISFAGIFSTIFGFLFGSVFGFENMIDAVWLRPINHMTTLPFIGKLNTVFIVAIAFGMGLILLTMILHIRNSIRNKDTGGALFDANGMAGFIFYASIFAVLVLFMTGHTIPAGIVLIIMFGFPLLLIALKAPLTAKLTKARNYSIESKGMFIVEAFFELFEMLLSYFSNTLSFVRIGAFAVSHAAMMEVVLMLSGTEHGTPNWIIVILGNLFVCGMEGLIVGIQVLRLEYYEMFSRFYKGNGKEFRPYSQI